jgi:hypothetical protein
MSQDPIMPQIHTRKKKSTRGVVITETEGRVIVCPMPMMDVRLVLRARWEDEPYIKELGTTGNACWMGQLWTTGPDARALRDEWGEVLEFGEETMERLMQLGLDLFAGHYDEDLQYREDATKPE